MSHHTTSRSFRPLPSSILSLSTLSLLLLGYTPRSSAFDCKEIHAKGVDFNFKALGGPHIVHWEDDADYVNQYQYKYNFTLDICNKLPSGDPKTQCHAGTRICAVRETVDLSGERNATIQPIEIAGTYTTQDIHRTIDARFELLRDSKSNSDAAREGVRAELHGGRFPFDEKKKHGIEQRAIIEFVCDKDRTGLEGLEDDKEVDHGKDGKDGKGGEGGEGGEEDENDNDEKGKDVKGERLTARDEGDEDGDKQSLRFVSYEVEDTEKDSKAHTLRLEWATKYACEDAPDDVASSHWGFFTWFIIIFFLAVAAYLIFGSWLNYNRYGARGWDLLPHGDTIRDIPYIFKDCARRVKDTVQGGGSRGGYSAV